jgi:hypothetical protein
LLYAGTTSLESFKYSILNDTVKKLKPRSQSAGNILENRTSETLRNGIVVENLKLISNHIPKTPINDKEFGEYLAGLIDGNGHFSSVQQLILVFSLPDAFLSYKIKSRLGYGNVKKIKNKNAYVLIVSNKKGILDILNLINGKLRTISKYNQVFNNILNHKRYLDVKNFNFTLNKTNNFNNY